MVEIGDGFRIPELLESVGARLREVGTTNRVRLSDYAEAIDDDTAFVLKVHPSNFEVTGFTSSVPVADLATLGVPVVVDIGSGLLAPHPRLPDEPSAAAALRAGADLVTASGDKLLGGPQCGLMLGRADLVDAAAAAPVRPRAARGQADPGRAGGDADRAAPAGRGRAGRRRRTSCSPGPRRSPRRSRTWSTPSAVTSTAAVGGGGAPGVELPSAAVSLPADLAAPLRVGAVPVVGRVEGGRLLLDLIAVPPQDDTALVDAVRAVAGARA